MVQVYTGMTPKKFIPKFIEAAGNFEDMVKIEQDSIKVSVKERKANKASGYIPQKQSSLALQQGTYKVWNDRIVYELPDECTHYEHYRYEG